MSMIYRVPRLCNIFYKRKTNITIDRIRLLSTTPSWIDKYVLTSIQPYLHLARADKQTGTFLLFWPCSWGVALAAPIGSFPDFFLMTKFGIGALIMRSAGCVINDIFDREIDQQVRRTMSRPLASGSLSLSQAVMFLGLQLSAGLGVLISFNYTTILLGFCSMPIVVSYPLMKRITYWPQLVLGCCFNWGVLVGWTSIHSLSDFSLCLPLYFSGVCWTLIYDTLYAYQDRHDDREIGVKSTPLLFGDHPQIILTSISMGMIGGLFTTGYLFHLTLPYYIGITGVMSHIQWQIWTADLSNNMNLMGRFSSNKYVGAVVTGAIIAGHF